MGRSGGAIGVGVAYGISGPHNRNDIRTYERTHSCRFARGADLRHRRRFLWRLSARRAASLQPIEALRQEL